MTKNSEICASATAANGVSTSVERVPASLTPREMEIVRLMAKGLSTIEIAVRLFVSIETIEGDQRQMARKLGVPDLTQIVDWAVRAGLIGP